MADVSQASVNREEAVRAKELAETYARRGEFARARRLFLKSQRLFPSPHTAQRGARCREQRVPFGSRAARALMRAAGRAAAVRDMDGLLGTQHAAPPPAATPGTPPGVGMSWVERLQPIADRYLSRVPVPARHRVPLMLLYGAIAVLLLLRMVGSSPRLGSLPGARRPQGHRCAFATHRARLSRRRFVRVAGRRLRVLHAGHEQHAAVHRADRGAEHGGEPPVTPARAGEV